MALNSKYDGIQIELPDGFTPIADDEPVFVLRGQDGLAVAGIRGYLNKCAEAGAPQAHLESVEAELHKWEEWQLAHPEMIKQPTTDHDASDEDDD